MITAPDWLRTVYILPCPPNLHPRLFVLSTVMLVSWTVSFLGHCTHIFLYVCTVPGIMGSSAGCFWHHSNINV